jgi:hypothetical protein
MFYSLSLFSICYYSVSNYESHRMNTRIENLKEQNIQSCLINITLLSVLFFNEKKKNEIQELNRKIKIMHYCLRIYASLYNIHVFSSS